MNYLTVQIKKHEIVLTGLLIFLSRLPFLNAGYGSEEDAWGMALTARRIAQSGIYEYSRLPGHPVPELIYALIYRSGPFGFNLLTAIISTVGILFFVHALKIAGIRNYLAAGLALAFTPVIYIASTNNMDYTWAMAFILVSLYMLFSDRPVLAGMALGIATGCRITSALCMLPFLLFMLDSGTGQIRLKEAFRFSLAAVAVALILFMPLFHRYGFSFFTFYDTLYPSFAKAFYKFTFAVYGTIGFFAIVWLKLILIKNKTLFIPGKNLLAKKINMLSITVIILYSALYWYLPQKAAFMVPAVPFVILFFAIRLDRLKMSMLALSLFLSCFLFGVNLSDSYRGGKPSALALPFSAGMQRAALDPLRGQVIDEHLKRKQCLAYARRVMNVSDTLNEKAAVIAGWWQGYILVEQAPLETRSVVFYYYAKEDTLISLKQKGYTIYYLPEQDYFNDERYGKHYTEKYAVRWNY